MEGRLAIRFDYLRGGRQVSLRNGTVLHSQRLWVGFAALGAASVLAVSAASAQYPGQVKKPEQNAPDMRAVAVLEWTGDQQHPKASRLIPVSVYDGQVLQDGGIYLARPAPLALSSEVEYELKDNGKTIGLFDVNSAGQQQGSWIGFGSWKPLPKPKPVVQAANTGKDLWGNDADDDKPVLHRKHGSGDSSGDKSGGSNAPAADPDRPTLHKKTGDSSGDSGSDSGSTGSEPAPDPDRPTLHKKTSDDDSASGGNAPAADPDRPTLKKQKDNPSKPGDDIGHVDSVQQLTDPNRPHLLRGKPADVGGDVLPTLKGLPADMHQAVAVSDARNRPEHLWTYSWANPDDQAKMKSDMEDIARKELGLVPAQPAAAPKTPGRATTSAARKKVKAAEPAPPAPLVDEQFRVFELAYGSGATLVLSAHTDGQASPEKFVTLVCQPDLYGKVVVLLKNVTDMSHLDETPRMRLVDAVDALADNRGELLFELRGASQRQFALYRVLRGQIDKIFVTGPAGAVPTIGDQNADSHS